VGGGAFLRPLRGFSGSGPALAPGRHLRQRGL